MQQFMECVKACISSGQVHDCCDGPICDSSDCYGRFLLANHGGRRLVRPGRASSYRLSIGGRNGEGSECVWVYLLCTSLTRRPEGWKTRLGKTDLAKSDSELRFTDLPLHYTSPLRSLEECKHC